MKILVCGGGGFIGGHLVKKLKEMNHNVTSVDLKENIYSNLLFFLSAISTCFK